MLTKMSKIGIYPGSFNPPTLAHAAIAEAALSEHDLDRLDIVMSKSALGKSNVTYPKFSDRVHVVRSSFAEFDNIDVVVTDKQLLSEMSQGYDLLVLGSDKWTQIQERRWYPDDRARTTALAALPTVTVAARSTIDLPQDIRLTVDPKFVQDVSSTAARDGAVQMMTDAARSFAIESGAWVDRARYERWRGQQQSGQ